MKQLINALCDKMQERIVKEILAENRKLAQLLKSCEQNSIKLEKRIQNLERRLMGEKKLALPQNKATIEGKRRLRITGGNIIEIRERLGLSQGAFADLMGVHRACLNRWELGRVKISQKSMAKIAPFRSMGKKELKLRLQKLEEAIWKD